MGWESEKREALAPVVLFVYNRPEHTMATIEALKKNQLSNETTLYIFSDGPKNENAEELVAKVRQNIRSVNGFQQVLLIEREKNWGLASNVIDGVTNIVNEYGRVIVLEDDLITSPYFLKYMNDALSMYENEQQVMQISGHMFGSSANINTDTFFLPLTTSWGWGTWKRAWGKFDQEANGYKKLLDEEELRYRFNAYGTLDYTTMLMRQMRGELDSWAIRWYWSVFKNNGLVLFPKITFIQNIGMDGSGTHYNKLTPLQYIKNKCKLIFGRTNLSYKKLTKMSTAIEEEIVKQIITTTKSNFIRLDSVSKLVDSIIKKFVKVKKQ
jgi:hypothetical protein